MVALNDSAEQFILMTLNLSGLTWKPIAAKNEIFPENFWTAAQLSPNVASSRYKMFKPVVIEQVISLISREIGPLCCIPHCCTRVWSSITRVLYDIGSVGQRVKCRSRQMELKAFFTFNLTSKRCCCHLLFVQDGHPNIMRCNFASTEDYDEACVWITGIMISLEIAVKNVTYGD